jgi:XTP/dITP diphosphohydrolase
MEKSKLLIGTSNPGKFNEITAVLKDLQLHLLSPADLNIFEDVQESGQTYLDNAKLKANFFYNKSGLNTLGEDSGIVVEALKDQLGVHTRRWGAGAQATDQEWLDYFMNEMQKFPNPEQRKAKFISQMVVIIDNTENLFYGETEGYITQTQEAPIYKGLPLSSVFKPVGFNQVYVALGEEQKNQISHRGKAIQQVKDFLINYYAV